MKLTLCFYSPIKFDDYIKHTFLNLLVILIKIKMKNGYMHGYNQWPSCLCGLTFEDKGEMRKSSNLLLHIHEDKQQRINF